MTRRCSEIIKIGHDIEIKVLEITEDGRVKLGFTAPKEVEIHRLEVYERIWGLDGNDRKPEE